MEIFFNTFQEVCDGVKDVLILAATNTPFALDQIRIGNTPKTISDTEFEDLAKATDGFSGSDISYFVKDALYEVVRAIRTTKFFKKSGEKWVPCKSNEKGFTLQEIDKKGENSKIEVQPCSAEHFENVRRNHKATVTKDDLEKFDEFTNKFGIYG
nr:protein SUPPRESSOR OF K(+) TRANSPORT GROWTH DEFECT 1-like [Quercus suber]